VDDRALAVPKLRRSGSNLLRRNWLNRIGVLTDPRCLERRLVRRVDVDERRAAHAENTRDPRGRRALFSILTPKARDDLRRVLIRDQADRDAISSSDALPRPEWSVSPRPTSLTDARAGRDGRTGRTGTG
jgi:hypothetical protein